MRNLHAYINQEYGRGSIFLLRRWEKWEKKMADFRNHRRFTIKCLKNNIIPVSIRLKTNIKTSKGLDIIRRAEKQLLNERIRSINNQLELFMFNRDTCKNQLQGRLEKEIMEECEDLIKRVIENRHNMVLERQKSKFESLQQRKAGGRSNIRYRSGKNAANTCIDEQYSNNNSNSNSNKNTSNNNRWVINLSDTPLTPNQEKLLARGPKFVIKPKRPPIEEYITAIEKTCPKLDKGDADELRVEVKKALKKAQNKKKTFNITKDENQALTELKRDKERVILTADKGVALVVMKKEDYIKKSEEILNTSTYKKIAEDPTSKQKNKLISILKSIKTEGGLKEEEYRKMYPTGAVSPKYYGLPKIHKQGIPLRPIVSSTGTVTYNTSKELANILKPLVGLSSHHVHNTKDFIDHIKEVRLRPEESIISYDVTSLFTSVPIKPVLNIIHQKLTTDQDLKNRTGMTIQHIIKLLEFCLNSTSFVFQGQYYQQMEGAAMGSPLSPIVANIFMEQFEKEALETAPHPPSLWKRFVDDTFVIIEDQYKDEFFQHLNSLHTNIKFTAETSKADGSIPFLDTWITPQRDGSLQTKVYRKPTHTHQYLQWDSHHSISNKYSVISSLMHRAKDVCSTKKLLEEEQKVIQEALQACKYPTWAIYRMKTKINSTNNRNRNTNTSDNRPMHRNSVTVPYNEGLSQTFKNICKRYGIQVHFKSGKTIKEELVALKDQDHITKKSGIIYRYQCDKLECDHEYIGETARTFGERFKEHLKAPSPIYDHSNISGHSTTINNFTVVGREEQNLSRLIKESMFIRVNSPSLNKNIGKYHLPHIWDEVLVNNTELKLK